MITLNKIERWYEPTDTLNSEKDFITQMLRNDHGFLSGLIKLIRPQKIVEVGVAEGGTTRMIVKTLDEIKCKSRMFSIDLFEDFWGRKTGYSFQEKDKSKYVDHTFLLGKYLVDCIEEIGNGIDLLILDTTHKMPGENIDFLCALPYLSKDAFVVLHDVGLSNIYAEKTDRIVQSCLVISTKMLFSAVTAKKFYNFDDSNIENIGAFQINEDTFKHATDLFFALSFIWTSPIDNSALKRYRDFFSLHYDRECMELFDLWVKNENNYRERASLLNSNFKRLDRILKTINKYKKIKAKTFRWISVKKEQPSS